jgi:hypothetical protein
VVGPGIWTWKGIKNIHGSVYEKKIKIIKLQKNVVYMYKNVCRRQKCVKCTLSRATVYDLFSIGVEI